MPDKLLFLYSVPLYLVVRKDPTPTGTHSIPALPPAGKPPGQILNQIFIVVSFFCIELLKFTKKSGVFSSFIFWTMPRRKRNILFYLVIKPLYLVVFTLDFLSPLR